MHIRIVLHFYCIYKNVHVWVMYMYSMEPCLLHCVSGSLSDFIVVYFIEIFNTFVLSQWNLSLPPDKITTATG